MRLIFLFISMMFVLHLLQAQDNAKSLDQTILELDSAFWKAYNECDIEAMSAFFTEDVEFYHDKNGLATGSSLIENAKKGLCGNPNWRLRREAVEGTVKVYPMNNYGAILSGDHVFYINESGKPERLDGLAKFTHVWRFKDNQWKMHRILSYDHGPAPYNKQRKAIKVDATSLKQFAGTYGSPNFGKGAVTLDGNSLRLSIGNFNELLLAESSNKFFIRDRNLQFEFVKSGKGKMAITVFENGVEVDRLERF